MLPPFSPVSTAQELTELSAKMLRATSILQQGLEVEYGQTPKTLVYEQGKLRLFRYNRETPAVNQTPVLIVYALVNRFEMMDLQPDRSLVIKMLENGCDVYVIDWGYPDRTDAFLTLNDYINGAIGDCVRHITRQHKIPSVNLLGVCQGGAFSCIYTALHPEKVKNLITMVTPIDFDVNDGLLNLWAKKLNFDRVVDSYGGAVAGDFLNTGFLMLKPMQKMQKYLGLMELDDADKVTNFLRMEKWVFDSPNQAGAAYRQYMKDLYQNNKLMKGELVIGGQKVNLKNITQPLLNIYAREDHIVPPSSTKPLNDLVGSADKSLYEFPGGHIGVFTGSRSQKELAPLIAKWLKDRD